MNIEKKVNAIMMYIIEKDEYEKAKIAEKIKTMVEPAEKKEQARSVEDLISEILVELGMPNNLKGYRFSIYAIKLATECPDILDAITSRLYPAVAEHYGLSSGKVERGIRHGIECTWDRCDIDVVEKYFGNTVSIDKGKPTNSEFIARIADIVNRRMKNGEE